MACRFLEGKEKPVKSPQCLRAGLARPVVVSPRVCTNDRWLLLTHCRDFFWQEWRVSLKKKMHASRHCYNYFQHDCFIPQTKSHISGRALSSTNPLTVISTGIYEYSLCLMSTVDTWGLAVKNTRQKCLPLGSSFYICLKILSRIDVVGYRLLSY